MPAILEDVKSETYDTWESLNTAADSTAIVKGQTPRSRNVLPDEKPGSIVTMPGLEKVGDLPSGNAARFMYTFRKSDGTSMVLISDNATVYKTTDFTTFTSIITGLASSFQLRAITLRDKVWLTNGSDAVRTYDGTTVAVLDGTAGTPTVPRGKFIEVWQERIWIGDISSHRSQVRFSALTDSSGTDIAPDNASGWPAANAIEFGQDDGDVVCGLRNYLTVLHVFKARSIYRVDGTDEFTYQPTRTSATTGSRLQESIQERDNLLEFIGTDGVYEFNGSTTEKVSDIIESVDLNQFSFDNIQQGSNQSLSKVWTSESDFTGGTLTRVSATRISGSVVIDGYTYSADLLPADDDPVWTKSSVGTSISESISSGILSLSATTTTIGPLTVGDLHYYRAETLSNTNGTRLGMRAKLTSSSAHSMAYILIADGTQRFEVQIAPGTIRLVETGAGSTRGTYVMDTQSDYHIYELKIEGTAITVYVDGTSRITYTALSTDATAGKLDFGIKCDNAGGAGIVLSGLIDYVAVIFSTISGSQALSDIYHVTDAVAAWGAFQATYSLNGGTIDFYVRSGTSSANCAADTWALITPGSTLAFLTTEVYIQWRADFTASGTASPELEDVTMGYSTSSSTAVTTQLVATVAWKQRYWLSGASENSSTNDTLILRGKRLYKSPWIQCGGFSIVSFCIFNNELYGASSTTDDIYRLDTGYNVDGAALDNYWETRDEVGSDDEIFFKRWPVVIVSGQKKGNYNLTVDISIDGGVTYPSGYQKLISLSGSGRFSAELRYPDLRGKQIRVRVRTNGIDEPFEVRSIRVFWRKTLLR